MLRLRQSFMLGAVGICACVLTLAACAGSGSGGGSSTGSTTAPPAATTIVQRAEQAPLKDATFTFTLNGSASSTTTTAATTGTGRLTTHPNRTDLTFPAIQVQGITTSAEVIIDASSGNYYVKVPALPQWLKLNPSALGVDVGVVSITDYSALQNLTFIAAETVNTIPTWHVRGTAQVANAGSGGSGTVTRTEDLWFRQSDYYPVKIAIQDVASGTTGGPTGTPSPTTTATATPAPTVAAQAALNETFTFTQWDSGITIALPATGAASGA